MRRLDRRVAFVDVLTPALDRLDEGLALARVGHLARKPDVARLRNPELVLGEMEGLVILDEIQAVPTLFNVLRVLVDRPGSRSRFLILGSASPSIVRDVSESLAGRVEFVELAGFDLDAPRP